MTEKQPKALVNEWAKIREDLVRDGFKSPAIAVIREHFYCGAAVALNWLFDPASTEDERVAQGRALLKELKNFGKLMGAR